MYVYVYVYIHSTLSLVSTIVMYLRTQFITWLATVKHLYVFTVFPHLESGFFETTG